LLTLTCSGGVVAFEICKLLEAQGRDVKYTGLLNIPPHISWRMRQLDWDEIAVNLALFLGLVPSEDVEPLRLHIAEKRELRQLSPAALHPPDGEGHSQSVKSNACARVVDLLRQTAPPARLLELGLDARALHRWIDVAADLARSAQVYEPQGKLACAATVFVAVPLAGLGTREEWRRNHLDAWQQYVNGPLRFVDVDGAHYTMLDDAHVESFAGCLRKELKLAGV
jgi:thioesterase domain-containing protein